MLLLSFLTVFFVTGLASALPQVFPPSNGTEIQSNSTLVPLNSTIVQTIEIIHRTQTVTDYATQLDYVTVTDEIHAAGTGLPLEAFTSTITLGIGQASPQEPSQPPQVDGQPATVTSTVYSHSAPLATLQPAVHWNLDPNDLGNLDPQNTQQLYFTQSGSANPNQPHAFASINASYAYPAAVVEHASSITAIQCLPNGLQLTFATPEAASAAQQSWSSALPFVLVTSTSGCDASGSTDSHSYFLVSSASFNGLVAILAANEVPLENAVKNIDLTWGHYNPTNTFSGSGVGSPTNTPSNNNTPSPNNNTPSPNNNTPSPGPSRGSGNNDNSTELGCGQPPASVFNGFPTAPCGDNFDTTLDAALGYVAFDQNSFSTSLSDVAPGLTDDNYDDYQDDDLIDTAENATVFRGRRFFKRGKKAKRGFFRTLFQKTTSFVQNAVQQVAQVAAQGISKGLEIAKNVLPTAVVDAISNFFSPSYDKTIPIELKPQKLVGSPWGQAYRLFQKEKEKEGKAGEITGSVALYCVDCGVAGQIHIKGQLSFSITDGITKGNVGVDGNLAAGLFLGLDAQAAYKKQFKAPIVDAGLPGLSIPKIITIGPAVTLDAELDIGIEATGKVIAGGNVSIPNFAASVDLVAGQTSQSGFKPEFKRRFEASGEIKATVGLGVPLTIGVGILIIPLGDSGKKLASIINKPSLQASAAYSYSTDNSGTCNNGIQWGLKFRDDTSYDLFGLKKGDLFNFEYPDLAGGCISGSTPGDTASGSSSSGSPGSNPSDANSSESNSSGSNSSNSGSPDTGTQDPGLSSPNSGNPASPDSDSPDSQPSDSRLSSSNSSTSAAEVLPPTHQISKALRLRQTPTNASSTNSSSLDDNEPLDFSSTEDDTGSYADGTESFDPTDNLSDADYNRLFNLSSSSSTTATRPNTDGSIYVTIHDTTNKYTLSADSNGVFNLQNSNDAALDSGTTFLSFNAIVGGDDDDRLINYFPAQMAAFAVSRLRMSPSDAFPRTADIVNLVPVNADGAADTPGVYVAVDTQDNVFYPVVCNLQGLPSKVFLVKDPVEGLKVLEREDLRFVVTGGVVQQCFYVGFVSDGFAGVGS